MPFETVVPVDFPLYVQPYVLNILVSVCLQNIYPPISSPYWY